MRYVKFTGSTPYVHTSYVQEAVFDDDTPIEIILRMSKSIAIENATRHAWMANLDTIDADLANEAYQNYLSACIDLSSWEFIDPASVTSI